MAQWISKDGKWHPAKEKIGLKNNTDKPFKHPVTGEMIGPGEPYIYEGPCRRALFELWEIDKSGKTTTLGVNFKDSPEFRQMVRELRFNSPEEYLTYVGYDEKASEEEFKAKASVISKHELPKKVEALQVAGGGVNTAGEGAIYGSFGNYDSAQMVK